MDEGRRRDYLAAMGIDVWVPRRDAVDWPDAVGAAPVVEPAVERPRSVEPEQPPLHEANPVAEPEQVDLAVARVLSPVRTADMGWEALETAVSGCRACLLCETRSQTVFGVGNRLADLFIIGEAPGADEDRAGEPFVGRAGQLLNLMLAGIGLEREQVYIANVLKCRPPGNRDPRPEEARQCEGYLMRQIELIGPRLILCVGRVAAQNLLQTDATVGSLRGRWLTLGPDAVPLRVTYHPAYLLRSPEQKAKAWEDLIAVARRLREQQ
jgi:uracil-DNA glycosylase